MRADLNDTLHCLAAERPVVLEGRWLGRDGSRALVTSGPVGVLQGGPDALAELPRWLAWHAGRYPTGAAAGFLSYELGACYECLPLPSSERLPALSFAYYPRLVEAHRPQFTPSGAADASLASSLEPQPPGAEVQTNFDRHEFIAAVRTIRGYLGAGDIYQANLTQQFSIDLGDRSLEHIYHRLSATNAAFGGFLKTPHCTIISNSPERFFRVSGRRILASPIKGTIARPGNAAEDRKAVANLLASAKDRAENVMIVDLVRNDLGRVCRFGSIEAKLFDVDSLPHIFHLVSHVRGTLRPGVGILELLRALFPCGSVTGAPKIRAMQILSEIETVPRGVSMGALGVILGDPRSDHCEMDFSVAIRTLSIQDGRVLFNVGGGIVYDSGPEAEYDEMMLKARPLLAALGVVESQSTTRVLAVTP